MHEDGSASLARHAFAEQTRLNLKWHKNTNAMQIILKARCETNGKIPYPNHLRTEMRGIFMEHWEAERRENKKLDLFYKSVYGLLILDH